MADVALLGAVIANDGGAFTKSIFPWLLAASPTHGFRLFNLLAVETSTVGGIVTAPQTLNLPVATPIIALAMWLSGLLALTAFIFRRTEP
jgi:Cu-processing system permease protein